MYLYYIVWHPSISLSLSLDSEHLHIVSLNNWVWNESTTRSEGLCECHGIQNCSVVSNCLWSHGLQHTRFPCPSRLLEFAQTHVHSVSDSIQPSHPLSPLLLLASVFPSIRVFSSESTLPSGGQSIGASASASIFPVNIQLISFRINS